MLRGRTAIFVTVLASFVMWASSASALRVYLTKNDDPTGWQCQITYDNKASHTVFHFSGTATNKYVRSSGIDYVFLYCRSSCEKVCERPGNIPPYNVVKLVKMRNGCVLSAPDKIRPMSSVDVQIEEGGITAKYHYRAVGGYEAKTQTVSCSW